MRAALLFGLVLLQQVRPLPAFPPLSLLIHVHLGWQLDDAGRRRPGQLTRSARGPVFGIARDPQFGDTMAPRLRQQEPQCARRGMPAAVCGPASAGHVSSIKPHMLRMAAALRIGGMAGCQAKDDVAVAQIAGSRKRNGPVTSRPWRRHTPCRDRSL